MKAHVLLNLLNELRKRLNARLAQNFIAFFTSFNIKFNNTGT